MIMSDLGDLYNTCDGLALAQLVRNKEIKSSELVQEAIDRIEQLNPQLNAVIHKMYDLALEVSKGDLADAPFQGVPFLLKDLLINYGGVPTRSGSRFHQDFVPDDDSELTRRYKAAGLIVVGKTNTPEYGLEPVTEPELFGPSHNPWDLTRTTGGSSGGSAAAVASRLVPLAHGSDGGGSIRMPASCCGVFGLKPTRGRNPLGPDLGEALQGLHCDHVLTRSVRDSAAILDTTAGPDVGAPYYASSPSRPFLAEVRTDPGKLRIAFTSTPLLADFVHEDCIKALEMTVQLCQELGHEMLEAVPQIDGKAFAKAFLTVIFAETRADIEEAEERFGRKATFRDYEYTTWVIGLLGKKTTAAEFARAIRLLQRCARQIGQDFETYDVLLTPTLALPPVVTGSLKPTPVEAFAMKLLGSLNAGGLLRRFGRVDQNADQVFSLYAVHPAGECYGSAGDVGSAVLE